MKTLKKFKKNFRKRIVKTLNIFTIVAMVFFQPGGVMTAIALDTAPATSAETTVSSDPSPSASTSDSKSSTSDDKDTSSSTELKADVSADTSSDDQKATEDNTDSTSSDSTPADDSAASNTNAENTVTTDEATDDVPVLTDDSEGQITPEAAMDEKAAPAEDLSGKECLKKNADIKDSSKDDWDVSEKNNTAETKDAVELGIKYIFPLNDKVSVTFSCLPKDPAKRTSLKIEQIKTADLDLPDGVVAATEYAYDITTDMDNGDFEYDLTLPNGGNKDATVSYVEKSVDAAKKDIKSSEVKKVNKDQIEAKDDTIEVSELDHFTIIIVIAPDPDPAINWPSEGDWEDYLIDGHLVNDFEDDVFGINDDSNGGSNVSPSEIDLASGALVSGTNPGNYATFQYLYDEGDDVSCSPDDVLFLRMRIAGDPTGGGGIYKSYHWDFIIDYDNDEQSDYVVDVFGGSKGTVGVYPNDPGALTYNPDTFLWKEPVKSSSNVYTRLQKENYDDANSTTDQYWMEVAIPVGQIPEISGLCGVTNLAERLFASTSASNTNPLQKDWMSPTGFFTDKELSKSAENLTNPGAMTKLNPAMPGDVIEYTLTVENTGNLEIPGYVIEDDISDLLEYSDILDNDSDSNGNLGIESSGIISWNAQNIPVGDTISEKFTVQIKPLEDWTGTDFVMTNVFGDSVDVNVVKYGSITIIKDAEPDDEQDFSFLATGTGVSNFSLDDDTDATLSDTKNFARLLPGAYSITEESASGWDLSSISCNAGTVDLANRKVDINLSEDENVTCTFTNELQQGTLTVIKHVINDNGGTKIASDFEINVTGESPSLTSFQGDENGTEVILNAGSYSVTEVTQSGYSESYSADCSGTMAPGESKTCTITNDDQAGTLIVKKVVINDNGGTLGADDFSFSVNGGQNQSFEADGQNELTIDAGTYTITEPSVSGYSASYQNCTDVVVPNGGSTTCTITNNDITAELTVVKTVINDNGGTLDAADFTMNVTGTNVSDATFAGAEDPGVTVTLNAGSYSVDESAVFGYEKTLGADCSGTIALGESKTCTITNNDIQPKLYVIKHVVNNNGGTAIASDFTMYVSGENPNPSSFSGEETPGTEVAINAGSYSVSESGPSGYTDSYSNDCSGSISVGETKTCTVTNDDQSAHIIVIKHVINDNGGTLGADYFTMHITGTAGTATFAGAEDPGVSTQVNAGTFNVTEDSVYGYASSMSGDCSGTVGVGETKTCTITNDDIQPKLTVTKVVNNNQYGTLQVSDFPLFIDATQVTSGAQNGFDAGTYTVSETNQTGYTGVITGDCASDGSVSLSVGDEKSCTITNTDNFGKIIIEKQTLPDGDQQTFDFTGTGSLTGTIGDDEQLEQIVVPGNYTVSEGQITSWDLTDISCNDSDSSGNPAIAPTASINVSNNETVNCTFTNTKRGHIIVKKNAIYDSDQEFTFHNNFGNGNPDTFTLVDDSVPGLPSHDAEVLPGKYQVYEDPVDGWQQESAVCDNGETINDIDVAPGETVTCTFTNEEYASITLVKNTIGGDGEFDFDATGDGLPADIDLTTVSGTASQTFSDLDQDNTYSFSENVPAGWDLTSATCDNGDPVNDITPNAGENITCTFANTKRGSIEIIKNTIGGDDTFDFTSNFGVNSLSTSGGSTSQTIDNLEPGTGYSISETAKTGWDLNSATCDYGTIGAIEVLPGQTTTCTFTNTKLGSITLVKDAQPNDPQDFQFTGNMEGLPLDLDDDDDPTLSNAHLFGGLLPGNYNITESNAGLGNTWDLTNIECTDYTDSIVDVDIQQRKVGIDLMNGENLICTFTNSKRGTIIIEKQTDSEGAMGNFDFASSVADLNGTLQDNGQLTAIDVESGSYDVTELQTSGFSLTDISCDDSNSTRNLENQTATINLEKGETVKCIFTNTRDRGSVVVNKIIDEDGDLTTTDDQIAGANWQFDVDGTGVDTDNPATSTTDNEGKTELTNLKTGEYRVTEITQPGFRFLSASCDNIQEGEDYDRAINGFGIIKIGVGVNNVLVSKDEITTCTFYNTPNGTIHGYKWNDEDASGGPGNGPEESLLSDWTINLYAWNGENYDTDPIRTMVTDSGSEHFGWYWFEHLYPGQYKVCEIQQDGWTQTYPVNQDENCHVVNLPDDNSYGFPMGENYVSGPEYNFGNTFVAPGLRIDKSNDADGVDKNPGDTVTYTLTVKAKGIDEENNLTTNQGNVKNVQVTDLPPAGFEYVSDSWTATSSLGGAHIGNLELSHPYASPGIWDLGTMQPDEVITLTYETIIDNNQDSGIYKDLAMASGTDRLGNTIQATYGDPEYFASTEVAVVAPPEPVKVKVPEVGETKTKIKHKTKEVLGAAIVLPATGSNTLWLIVIAMMLILGSILIVLGKKRDKLNSSVKNVMKAVILAVALGVLAISGGKALAGTVDSNIAVKIEQPASPSSNEFEIGFTALDIQGQDMTVECYKDTDVTPFDTIDLNNAGGNSGNCSVTSSVISTDGTYEFYVRAIDKNDNTRFNQSGKVSVEVNTGVPTKLRNYDRNGDNCKVTFTTAKDGITAGVELYRSKNLSFTANASTLVKSISIGPNKNSSITDNKGNCGDYYYAVRAVSASGVGSDFVGDENVDVHRKTKTKTTTKVIHPTVAGAIPVAGGGAAVAGEQTPPSTEENVAGENAGGENIAGQGNVQGESTWREKIVNKWPWILLVIVILGVAYYAYKKSYRKESKNGKMEKPKK